MKKYLLSLCLIALFAFPSFAEQFTIHTFYEGEANLKARDKANGQPLWQSKIKTVKANFSGKPYLYTVEEGSGKYGKEGKQQSWRAESYSFMEGAKITPYQVKLVFKNSKGEAINSLEKFYDRKTRKVTCRINGKVKEFEFKDDLVDREILGTCLRNYPFEEKRDFESHLLTHEPTLYKITFKYRGIEKLPAGDCYKLEMIPDLGALNLFSAFVPKTYFWYKVEAPHDFVRYEGLESGLGTPYIIMESP